MMTAAAAVVEGRGRLCRHAARRWYARIGSCSPSLPLRLGFETELTLCRWMRRCRNRGRPHDPHRRRPHAGHPRAPPRAQAAAAAALPQVTTTASHVCLLSCRRRLNVCMIGASCAGSPAPASPSRRPPARPAPSVPSPGVASSGGSSGGGSGGAHPSLLWRCVAWSTAEPIRAGGPPRRSPPSTPQRPPPARPR